MSELKNKLNSPETKNNLMRALYIILFFVIGYILVPVIALIAIFQFIYTLVMNGPNANIMQFSQSLGQYLFDIVRFLTYNTDTKPFPFSPWPPNNPQ